MEDATVHSAPANLKSKVWKYFGFHKNSQGTLDKSAAVCRTCKTSIKYTGSTTNLALHLRRRHSVETEEKNAQQEASKSATSASSYFQSALADNSTHSKAITEAIGYFICKDMCPYSVVENAGFRQMIRILEPKYKLPSRQHFSEKCIPGLYEEAKREVSEFLSTAERVAFTTDAWTSRATHSYVTITVHYVAPDWSMKTHVLQTRVFNESHTGKNIGALLRDACMEWKIEKKNPALVTDNARNMIAAGQEAEMNPHVTCIAHTINLASQKAFQVQHAARVLGQVRRIVTFFHHSPKASEILHQNQLLLGLPSHKLIQDVCTLWNSSYDMLERFLEQQPAVFAGLMSRELRKGEDVNTLTEEDLATIEAIVKLMEPVKVATTLLCEEDNPTLSMVAPVQAKLRKHFSAVDGDLHIIAEMKARFLEDFQKRYQRIQDTLHVASALDPRFKVLSFIDDDKIREQTYLSVLTEALTLHKKGRDGEFEKGPAQRNPMPGEDNPHKDCR
ncbi:E3 SUMO-protein ligase ZBED1-like isoform X2 [Melanotaenia boesemani]|uniref:E3 SUMO-protein ligase ZBED1-like isoform X2 n=1 Tax=Melanotaenia boesemani TaxID=1250792 RepID=UPI001C03DE4C|nr:E3 SUMO-protein ligase ZBED1-like isoform X2 [Melanotaenia boesemani]